MSEIDELRARIAALEDENASLKDDLKAAVGGLGGSIREDRDQYRRERDEYRRRYQELCAAVRQHTLHGQNLNEAAFQKFTISNGGLTEAWQAESVPLLVEVALNVAARQGEQSAAGYSLTISRMEAQGGTDPNIELTLAAHVYELAGVHKASAAIITATRRLSGDPHFVCAEIIAELRRTLTVSVKLVERLPREWIRKNLRENLTTETLRTGLIEAYRDRDIKIVERNGSLHRNWLKTIEEAAAGIMVKE